MDAAEQKIPQGFQLKLQERVLSKSPNNFVHLIEMKAKRMIANVKGKFCAIYIKVS